MDFFTLLKTLHVIGAAVLFGTGAGIAFFMLMAHRTRDAALIAHTARIVIVADMLFTASAVILQPLTGAALAQQAGLSLFSGWIGVSLILYAATGLFWLPVVWIQVRMKNLALEAAGAEQPLPDSYFVLFRIWFALGFPAFASVAAIFWLMIAKPDF